MIVQELYYRFIIPLIQPMSSDHNCTNYTNNGVCTMCTMMQMSEMQVRVPTHDDKNIAAACVANVVHLYRSSLSTSGSAMYETYMCAVIVYSATMKCMTMMTIDAALVKVDTALTASLWYDTITKQLYSELCVLKDLTYTEDPHAAECIFAEIRKLEFITYLDKLCIMHDILECNKNNLQNVLDDIELERLRGILANL
jgi:hypothetical protein